MCELFRSNAYFFDPSCHASFDEHALSFLTYHHAGNRNAFVALIIVPGYQFILLKLRLERNSLFHLDHFTKTSYLG